MANFYQCPDGTPVNCDLVTTLRIDNRMWSVNFHFVGGGMASYSAGNEEDAQQELSDFLAHCEGEFKE